MIKGSNYDYLILILIFQSLAHRKHIKTYSYQLLEYKFPEDIIDIWKYFMFCFFF